MKLKSVCFCERSRLGLRLVEQQLRAESSNFNQIKAFSGLCHSLYI